MHIKKALSTSAIAATLFGCTLSASAETTIKPVTTNNIVKTNVINEIKKPVVKEEPIKVSKNVKLYDADPKTKKQPVVKVDFLNTKKFNTDKGIQNAMSSGIRGFVKGNYTTSEYKTGAKINVTYTIKHNSGSLFSVRAMFYETVKNKSRLIGIGNFNLSSKYKSSNKYIMLDSVIKDRTAINKYLADKNKKQWGITRDYDYSKNVSWYIDTDKSVVFCYNALDLNKKADGTVYLTRVPASYFNFAKAK